MRRDQQSEDPSEVYEIPNGVVTKRGGEEKTFRVLPSKTPGKVFIHIQVNTSDRRKYYQWIEVDSDIAYKLAEKVNHVAEIVENIALLPKDKNDRSNKWGSA